MCGNEIAEVGIENSPYPNTIHDIVTRTKAINKIQCKSKKCGKENFDDCIMTSSSFHEQRKIFDPRARWRKMSMQGLYDGDELRQKNTRKQAHLKSDINYNWEKIMQNDGGCKLTLRRKEHNAASRLLGCAFRGNKLEWTRKRKTKKKKHDFQIPTILITEVL
ncbi:uncharacterized protein [Acropora muricata]|uniref:uncharacterized protein isoform X1 n=1 Tax=Acropora muricata TaxID=159855 RepID=UPI0010FCB3D2